MTALDLSDRVLWRVLRIVGLEPTGDRRALTTRRAAREWRDPDAPAHLGHTWVPRLDGAP